MPAPILAERLGLHQSRASEWVRAAGASYADYVALLTHGRAADSALAARSDAGKA